MSRLILHSQQVFQWILPLIHALIPATLKKNPSVITRAENLVAAALLAITVMPAFGLLFLALNDTANARACFTALIGVIVSILALKVWGRIVLAREILLATVFFLLLTLTFYLGGIGSPAVIWFAVCPIIATAAGGSRAGVGWSVMTLLAVVGIYVCDVLAVFPAEPVIKDMRLLAMVSIIVFVLTVAMFLMIFERVNASAISKLDQALAVIQDLAIRDELTSVFNRRELLRFAEQEKFRADRQGSPFCACLIDIDFFKRINDTFGHAAGDRVLKQVASTIQGAIRKIDCFGRYGGEEFLLVLVGTEARAAQAFIERLREIIAAIPFAEVADDQKVTISIGVAQYRSKETIEQTLSRADRALYEAKHAGRNRVVIDPGILAQSL